MADAPPHTSPMLFATAAARARTPRVKGDTAPRAYPVYRPSGVAWLGDVPAHWRTKPLRFACRLNPTKGEVSHLPADTEVSFVPMESVREFGGMDLSQTRPIEAVFQGYTYFRDGDIVAAKITPCFENGKGSVAAGLTNGLGFGTTELHTLRPGPEFDGQFLFYMTLSHEFRHQGAGHMYGAGGQKRVPEDFLRNFLSPLPPLPEQRAIAGWLDERTRRIDELVAAKRRLIGLLAEQRTALSSHAVTKGLEPHDPMKPSGIDWLGDVPRHWEVAPMYARYSVELGKMLDAKRITGEHLIPYIRNVDVRWDSVQADDLPEMDIEPHEYGRFILQPGDMVACEGGEVGRAAFWPSDLPKCAYQKAIHRIRPLRPARDYPRFLYYVMYTGSKCGVFIAGGNPNTIPHLTGEALRVYRFAFPPIDEQRAIVAHLDAASAKFDALTAATETAIARLTEYRQALISAAVTGKINVCGGIVAVPVTGGAVVHEAPVIAGRIGEQRRVGGANKHFQRTVLAAQIIAAIGDKPTFGRIKLQKAMVLAEYHLRLDEIQSEPVRAAAGPFDNQMMQSVHAQLKRSQWYAYDQARHGAKYGALARAGGHAEYFDRYWSDRRAGFDALMKTLDPMKTEQAEIVATLYAAWNDFLIDGTAVTNDALVAEVSNNWHPEKAKITEAQWRAALPWMRDHELVPTGFGASTRQASPASTPRSRT